jgi:hypothetical protein
LIPQSPFSGYALLFSLAFFVSKHRCSLVLASMFSDKIPCLLLFHTLFFPNGKNKKALPNGNALM